jgi:hypothetical protein
MGKSTGNKGHESALTSEARSAHESIPPRYRERLSEIDRRYDHKRDKVERNLWHD